MLCKISVKYGIRFILYSCSMYLGMSPNGRQFIPFFESFLKKFMFEPFLCLGFWVCFPALT